MAPRSMTFGLLAIAAVALAAQVAWADDGAFPDDTILTPMDMGDADLAASDNQHRALLAGGPSKPAACINGQIKERFTAKVAVLIAGNRDKSGNLPGSWSYGRLLERSIKPRLDRYNKKYKLKLSYSVASLTTGSVNMGAQKWYYYNVTFVIGKCGKYKSALVAQLKVDLQPRSIWVKKYRIESYPYKA